MTLVESLARSARMALPAIARGVREGFSIARIGEAVRGGGIRIANDSLRALVAAEREIWRAGNALKFLNLSSRPNPRNLPQALTSLRRQYSFTVEVQGTLIQTGKAITQNVTVTTDSLLTRRQIQDLAVSAVESSRARYGISVDRAMLVRGVKAGSLGTL